MGDSESRWANEQRLMEISEGKSQRRMEGVKGEMEEMEEEQAGVWQWEEGGV